jgi:hypothetical protein
LKSSIPSASSGKTGDNRISLETSRTKTFARTVHPGDIQRAQVVMKGWNRSKNRCDVNQKQRSAPNYARQKNIIPKTGQNKRTKIDFASNSPGKLPAQPGHEREPMQNKNKNKNTRTQKDVRKNNDAQRQTKRNKAGRTNK